MRGFGQGPPGRLSNGRGGASGALSETVQEGRFPAIGVYRLLQASCATGRCFVYGIPMSRIKGRMDCGVRSFEIPCVLKPDGSLTQSGTVPILASDIPVSFRQTLMQICRHIESIVRGAIACIQGSCD